MVVVGTSQFPEGDEMVLRDWLWLKESVHHGFAQTTIPHPTAITSPKLRTPPSRRASACETYRASYATPIEPTNTIVWYEAVGY